MAQKRTERKTGIEYGKGGLGKLVKLDGKRARIDFDDGQSVPFQVVQGNVFEDENATMPKYVPFVAMKDNTSLPVRASFEQGDKRLLFINPASGEYQVKFLRFQGPEGSEPVWTEKEGSFVDKSTGRKKTYREANPFVEIIDGRWKGCIIRGRLFDNFGQDEEDGNTTIYFGKKGTSSQNLEDFCYCVGFEYWQTPYTENLLPEIARVGLENSNEFSIVLVNGYIANWIAGLNEDEIFGDAPNENSEIDGLLEN